MKLLEIQSSPRGESSDSITLTKSFIEACKSDNTSIVVDTLNGSLLNDLREEFVTSSHEPLGLLPITYMDPWLRSICTRIQT